MLCVVHHRQSTLSLECTQGILSRYRARLEMHSLHITRFNITLMSSPALTFATHSSSDLNHTQSRLFESLPQSPLWHPRSLLDACILTFGFRRSFPHSLPFTLASAFIYSLSMFYSQIARSYRRSLCIRPPNIVMAPLASVAAAPRSLALFYQSLILFHKYLAAVPSFSFGLPSFFLSSSMVNSPHPGCARICFSHSTRFSFDVRSRHKSCFAL